MEANGNQVPQPTDQQRVDLEHRLTAGTEEIKAHNEADAAELGKIATKAPGEVHTTSSGVVMTQKEYEHDVLGKVA